MKPIVLRCKEPKCGENVEYKPDPIPALTYSLTFNKEKKNRVYLKCPNGHVHEYEVPWD